MISASLLFSIHAYSQTQIHVTTGYLLVYDATAKVIYINDTVRAYINIPVTMSYYQASTKDSIKLKIKQLGLIPKQ